MDIFELAKNIEKEGKEYYLKLAKESPEPSLAGVFRFLAKEEQLHYDIFTSLQNKEPVSTAAGESSLEARKMFESLSSHFKLPEMFYDYTAAYMRALEMERKSIKMYEDMFAKATTERDKKTLSFLVTEEERHEHLLEHLIEFVNEPNVFLENAEFNHLAED